MFKILILSWSSRPDVCGFGGAMPFNTEREAGPGAKIRGSNTRRARSSVSVGRTERGNVTVSLAGCGQSLGLAPRRGSGPLAPKPRSQGVAGTCRDAAPGEFFHRERQGANNAESSGVRFRVGSYRMAAWSARIRGGSGESRVAYRRLCSVATGRHQNRCGFAQSANKQRRKSSRDPRPRRDGLGNGCPPPNVVYLQPDLSWWVGSHLAPR